MDTTKDARARSARRTHYVRASLVAQQTTADQAAGAMLKALEDIYQKARPRSLTLNGPVVDYYVEKSLVDVIRPVITAAKQAGIKP